MIIRRKKRLKKQKNKMKHVKEYYEFLSEDSKGINPAEVALVKDLEKAMLSNFREVSYGQNGKDNTYYEWSKGYARITNTYEAKDWSWLDPKKAKILQNCNIQPLYVKASVTYHDIINADKTATMEPYGGIGVSGLNYINNYKKFDLTNPKKSNIAKEVKDWIKFSQSQPLNDDLISRLFQMWHATKSEYKTINTRDQGIGRHASVHITKSYDKAYVIKDLNVALGKSEKETEDIIKNHYMFKKDRLDFDWKQGVMIVGGQYTEVWD
jgi:hypothetical protein